MTFQLANIILQDNMAERIYHKGVPIDNIPREEAIKNITTMLAKQGRRTNHIVTLTPSMYIEARRDQNYNNILARAVLVVPESTGLSLYSRLHGPRLERVSGHQLVEDMIRICADKGKKVLLLGSIPENRALAMRNLKVRYQNLIIDQVPGEYSFRDAADSQRVVSTIDAMSPDLCIMAIDEIAGERWIDQWLIGHNVNAGVIGGFGRTIDITAHPKNRPPDVVSRLGLASIHNIPSMTPARRKRFFMMLPSLASLAVKDLITKK